MKLILPIRPDLDVLIAAGSLIYWKNSSFIPDEGVLFPSPEKISDLTQIILKLNEEVFDLTSRDSEKFPRAIDQISDLLLHAPNKGNEKALALLSDLVHKQADGSTEFPSWDLNFILNSWYHLYDNSRLPPTPQQISRQVYRRFMDLFVNSFLPYLEHQIQHLTPDSTS